MEGVAVNIIRRKIAQRQENIADLKEQVVLNKARLEELIEILREIQGGESKTQPQQLATPLGATKNRILSEKTLNELAEAALERERGYLSPNDLAEKVKEEKQDVNKASLLSGVYRQAKKGKIFTLREDSKIGLLKWKKEKSEMAQLPAANGWSVTEGIRRVIPRGDPDKSSALQAETP